MADWRKRRYMTIALFLIPGSLFYAFLVLNPIVQSFILATFRWVTLRDRVFVGFDNVVTVFRDRFFWKSCNVKCCGRDLFQNIRRNTSLKYEELCLFTRCRPKNNNN